MLKDLLDKKKRERMKDNIDVVFAVITIVSFVANRVQEKRRAEEEQDQHEVVCGEVVATAS